MNSSIIWERILEITTLLVGGTGGYYVWRNRKDTKEINKAVNNKAEGEPTIREYVKDTNQQIWAFREDLNNEKARIDVNTKRLDINTEVIQDTRKTVTNHGERIAKTETITEILLKQNNK